MGCWPLEVGQVGLEDSRPRTIAAVKALHRLGSGVHPWGANCGRQVHEHHSHQANPARFARCQPSFRTLICRHNQRSPFYNEGATRSHPGELHASDLHRCSFITLARIGDNPPERYYFSLAGAIPISELPLHSVERRAFGLAGVKRRLGNGESLAAGFYLIMNE